MKARILNETSWILINDYGTNCGIITKNDQGFGLMKPKSRRFNSIEELIKTEFPKSKFSGEEERESGNKEKIKVHQYPTKHEHATLIKENLINDITVYSYKTDENSQVEYAAGYYGLNFSNGMTLAFCPKLATIIEYGFLGPFETDFDAKFQIKIWNRDNNESND